MEDRSLAANDINSKLQLAGFTFSKKLFKHFLPLAVCPFVKLNRGKNGDHQTAEQMTEFEVKGK